MALCANPYAIGVIPAPCTKCYPCRVNRSRVWSHRIMLETFAHEFNSFVTLTYDDEKIPEGGNLSKNDVTNWLKRLREKLYPRKVRYYLVGEYGENTKRPHYHGALFGVSEFEGKLIEESWGNGFTYLDELNYKTASYVAGYVTKKLRSKEEDEKCGRVKEFSKMSLKPGIGAVSMDAVAAAIRELPDMSMVWGGDVPSVLRSKGQLRPLGRYLRGKLREKLGRGINTPKSTVEEYRKKMQELFREVIGNAKDEEERRYLQSCKKKNLLVALQKQKLLNFEARMKIYGQRRNKL